MKSAILFSSLLLAFATTLSINAAPSAESIMKEAQKKAEAEGKNVFLAFSTTGCAWCKVLKNFIDSEEIKPIFTKYFVPAQLMLGDDANTNPGASVYEGKYGPTRGVPFHAFITPDGKKIVDSNENGNGNNIGYPAAPNEIVWFISMVKKAAPKISPDEVDAIEKKLKAFKRG
jgi:hypothetical protein